MQNGKISYLESIVLLGSQQVVYVDNNAHSYTACVRNGRCLSFAVSPSCIVYVNTTCCNAIQFCNSNHLRITQKFSIQNKKDRIKFH